MTNNPFMNLFPGLFTKPKVPVATDPSQNPMMAMLSNLIQPTATPQAAPSGFDPKLIQSLLGEGVDAVGRHNARSNLPSSSPDSTGPWSGPTPFFKPMDQAFPELAGNMPQAANPWAGVASSVQPNATNPWLANLSKLLAAR